MPEKKETEVIPVQDELYVTLYLFADRYASKYGVELMGGFVFTQEAKKQFAKTEADWHSAIEAFAKEGVN
jgi:hypothetical protein